MARWCALALAAAAVVVAMMVPFTAALAVPLKMEPMVHEVRGASWVSGETYKVGDTLSFKTLVKAGDDLVEVGEKAYDACNPANDIIKDIPESITLATPGHHFYISKSPENCHGGQKLDINVAPAAAAAPAAAPGAPALGNDNSASTSSRVASLFVSLFTVALGFLFY